MISDNLILSSTQLNCIDYVSTCRTDSGNLLQAFMHEMQSYSWPASACKWEWLVSRTLRKLMSDRPKRTFRTYVRTRIRIRDIGAGAAG